MRSSGTANGRLGRRRCCDTAVTQRRTRERTKVWWLQRRCISPRLLVAQRAVQGTKHQQQLHLAEFPPAQPEHVRTRTASLLEPPPGRRCDKS